MSVHQVCPEAAGFPKKGDTGAGCRLYYELVFIVKGRASYVKRPLSDFFPFLLPTSLPHQLLPRGTAFWMSVCHQVTQWALKVKGSALPFPSLSLQSQPHLGHCRAGTGHPILNLVGTLELCLGGFRRESSSPREFGEGADSLAQES